MPFHPVLEEWDAELRAGDPLGFPGSAERLQSAGGDESVRAGRTDSYAFIESRFEVHGGTLGVVAGERVVRAYDRARDLGLPMVVSTRSGGARVQEGTVALAQLVRTAAAAGRHAAAGLLSLGVYGSPTTGGVFVSYASLADLRAAHPEATIGFAGPRVAEEALGTTLPGGSHTARALYDRGWLDALVEPGDEAAGYRLAQRAVALAGRVGLPVLTLVDTPGADPSTAAELDGIGVEMARTFAAFAACPTPVVAVCVGEGGSGGALALCGGDTLLICEHAIFTVIGPEGAAAILERDPAKGPEVAERLHLTAGDQVGAGHRRRGDPRGRWVRGRGHQGARHRGGRRSAAAARRGHGPVADRRVGRRSPGHGDPRAALAGAPAGEGTGSTRT